MLPGTDGVEPAAVEVRGEPPRARIERVVPGERPRGAEDLRDLLLAPALVDIHTNGWGGIGAPDVAADPARLDDLSCALAATGVGSYVLTAISAPRAETASLCAGLRTALDRAAASPRAGAARCLGVHLEGPYIAGARRGAHPAAAVRPPDPAEMAALANLLGPWLRMVTLAPELDGALDLVRWLRGRGVAVAAGHTDATFSEMERAVAAGATLVTHLFNAMRPFHHREPGAAGAALVLDSLAATVIADGVHVSDGALRLALRAKPLGLALVSDAIPPAGLPDGTYTFGGLPVTCRDGIAMRPDGTLSGSVASLAEGVGRLARLAGDTPRAVSLATREPARILGLSDAGRLEPGALLDLVAFDAGCRPVRILLGGVEVAPARRP